ncbi:MAG: tRNA uridine-5-carboxymethylaminomethyl(34) synthesis GTPase MnmE [Lachnospiraceae bacterium]|nr:tRNA uridine-5-carboxymethylaminomethyl(34) synthesis GTPase MnmE [Lachnospiraceae bacterium]
MVDNILVKDTIVGLSTPLSTSGIGVIRVSGKDAIPLIDKIFKGKDKLINADTHTVHYGHIYNVKKVVDEVLVTVMKAPRTYTREDVVEISCHGGIYIIREILDLIISLGIRPSEPGEFTKRAFLNGRIDLTQAEAVMDLISSENEKAHDNALMQLSGVLQKKVGDFREAIIHETAYIEAALDDPEHYDLTGYQEDLKIKLLRLRDEMKKLADSFDEGVYIKEGIITAIVGKPNVGKSSLLNSLLQRERAIVTEIPGTTRDTIEENVMIGGISLHLIDTAGIRETNDIVEKIGVEKSLSSMKEADLILYLIDGSQPLSDEDKDQLSYFSSDEYSDKPVIVLINKSDLELEFNIKEIEDKFDGSLIVCSAKNRDGFDELSDKIKEIFFKGKTFGDDDFYLTGEREKNELLNSVKSIDLVLDSIENEMSEDFLTIDLLDAYASLGRIIGEQIEDDLADRIFSEFCMGK